MVGDLAQFMTTNSLDERAVREQAETLSFPTSVVEYFQGALGVPHGGFPQPLQGQVVKELPVFKGRPGAEMPSLDLDSAMTELASSLGKGADGRPFNETDLMSSVMYPKVFEQYQADLASYGDVSKLPTRAYVEPMELGEEVQVELQKGKTLGIKLQAVGQLNVKEASREVFFDFNGVPRSVVVTDRNAAKTRVSRARALDGVLGSVGAPMPGVVVETRVKQGEVIEAGTPMVTLSAMKMETVVAAPVTGRIVKLVVESGDDVQAGDLLVELE